MKVLSVCLRWTALAWAVAVVVAFAVALQRLFPSAPALAGLGLLQTLALPLASLALELGLLGGVPVGFALAVMRTRPTRAGLVPLLAVPAVLAAGVLLLARQVDRQDESPGSVVEGLIAAARQSCAAGGDDVTVPVVNVTLRCRDGSLNGQAPIGGGEFVARELLPSSDLSRLELKGFELSLPPRQALPGLRVQAGEARLRGLKPWGRARSQPWVRFWSAWLAVVACSAVVALRVRSQRTARGVGIGLAAALATVLTARALDRSPTPWALLLLPLAGVGTALFARLASDLFRVFRAQFRTRRLRRARAIARAAGRW